MEFFRPGASSSTHPHGPSPIEDSSPHSSNSQSLNFARNYSLTPSSGLDRLLQSPQRNFGRLGMEQYGSHIKDDGPREDFVNFNYQQPQQAQSSMPPSSGPTAKRGSKACVACRKGKNRCEGDPTGRNGPCRRCMLNSIPCVYEKASERNGRGRTDSVGGDALSGEAEGRVLHLERSVNDLTHGQNQIQNALQQILAMLPQHGNQQISAPSALPQFLQPHDAVATASIFQQNISPPSIFNTSPANLSLSYTSPAHPNISTAKAKSPQNTASGRSGSVSSTTRRHQGEFPKLPGFAPPDHSFGTYGIIPLSSVPPSPSHSRRSSVSSVSATSEAELAQDTLTAPIQALQALANAADHAAASAEEKNTSDDRTSDEDRAKKKRKKVTIDDKAILLRVKKKKRPDPTPRNPFPDVVTKGLVTETEARELWDIFFTGCHYFVPLWDKSYDTFETYIERTPFSTNGVLAVAAKIRAGNGPLGSTFQRCLEEAQGIARSTLFGPIVRKEAVMAMLILSVWSQNGWLPCGHALRMGLDMNLHRALDKLADTSHQRSEADERELVVSARIWLNCFMWDTNSSLGTAKPLMMKDDSSVRRARVLLSHPMASETDARLIAGVELVLLRVRVIEHLSPLHGKVDAQTISFVKRMFSDYQNWYHEWHTVHRQKYEDSNVLLRLLEAELVHAQLWTVCVALRGVQWDNLPKDQRELAFQAKDAALRCLEIFLRCSEFRAHLKYATHDQLVSVAFAAVFLLKIAILYPTEIPLAVLISQVSELAHVLSAECFAERYALTLRLMLSNFRRKTGALSTVPGTPRLYGSQGGETLPTMSANDIDGGLQSLLSLPQMGESMDGMTDWNLGLGNDGFSWPTEFSPSNLPVWLQDGNVADLGLPVDGSDSLFLPPELANMFLPSGSQSYGNYHFSLPDSGDVGAEAW